MSSHPARQTEEGRAQKRFSVAKEGRKYEIDKFWQRSAFFWVFIAAAFVAFAKAEGEARLPLACFGLVSSFAWSLQNRGSKYWHEAWEQKVARTEIPVLAQPLFHRIEPLEPKGFWGASRYSVTKLAIALSDFAVALWLVLAFQSTNYFEQIGKKHSTDLQLIGLFGTFLYCVSMLKWTRSPKPKSRPEAASESDVQAR